ncbi:MAG: fasciclin domain-containing protein [Planctomycetota bacterium]
MTTARLQSLAVVAAVGLLAACSSNNTSSPPPSTIAQQLPTLGFSALAAAITSSGLEATLSGPGPFTLFAPTDQAFAALPPGAVGDPAQGAVAELADVLLYHTATGVARAADVSALSAASTLGGEVIVDRIGGQLFLNDARVVDADIEVGNGVIHAIDRVLLPRVDVMATLRARGLDTLVAAITAAGLDDDLRGAGPFTVLAPTDAAFGALDPTALADLLLPQNQAQLIDLLSYHVIPQQLTAGAALAAETASTLRGTSALFAAGGDGATVNGALISAINIPCSNGVIHVVDRVLQPPAHIPALASAAGLTTLAGLLVAAELDDDLAQPGPFTVFAPTDQAFADLPAAVVAALTEPANLALLQQVLLYHVAAGEQTANAVLSRSELHTLEGSPILVMSGPMLNDAALVQTDVLAGNGIVHVIDRVLIPPGFTLP